MMEVSPMANCELLPSRSLQAVFAQHLSRLNHAPTMDDFLNFGFEDHLKQFFADNSGIIPVLNDGSVKGVPRSGLIRVRAMVQSVASPEFYHLVYEEHQAHFPVVKRSGKYIENTVLPSYIQYRHDHSTIQERLPAYLIPYPCETKWSRSLSYAPSLCSATSSPLTPIDNTLPQASPRPKRGRENSERAETVVSEQHLPLETPENVAAVINRKLDDLHNRDLSSPSNPLLADGTELSPHLSHHLSAGPNYPVPDNFGTPLWAKFYPPHEIKPNDLVDCLGILSEAPSQLARGMGASALDDVPAPDAPRFHVVLMEPAGEGHPLIPNNAEEREVRRLEVYAQITAARQSMLEWMACALGGDALAAEYLLFNLISRPTLRQDQVTEGHLPLNFIVPAESAPLAGDSKWTRSVRSRIEHVLETLCTRRHTLELTPEVFESRNLVPYISPITDRLESGILQLPSGTHLLIDEENVSRMLQKPEAKDKLEDVACFIHNQTVHYDVISYKLPFHIDCPVVVLSQGKSIFEITCALPIHSDLSTPAPHHVDEDQLNLWRALIGFLRLAEWSCQDEQVLSAIEDDFVNIRLLQGNEVLTPELFVVWNIIARSSAVSQGHSTLTEAGWAEIKGLEASRLQRL